MRNNRRKITYVSPLSSGMNRREFLQTSAAIALLAGFTQFKPAFAELNTEEVGKLTYFSNAQKATLDAVQMQLFPDDGDGPSARDINAVGYLQWAMHDPANIADGDPAFITRGIGWLSDLSISKHGKSFTQLSNNAQDKVLKQISSTQVGENWLSLLIYYLTEALLLDPVYGGNTNGVGWKWLEHQAGFPRPIPGKTYRDFET